MMGQVNEAKPKPGYDNPNAIGNDQLLAALDENNWVIKATAQSLNLSRTSLYERMKSCPDIRKIDEISDTQLRKTMRLVNGSYGEWAKALRVGREALRKRVKSLADQ